MIDIIRGYKMQIMAILLLVAALSLTACAGNRVDLNYSPIGPSLDTASNLPSVMVAEFQNGTGQLSVGADSDGAAIEPASSPTAWVSEALADELVRLGVRASYTPYSTATGYTIQGTLDQFWIEQTGPAQYKVKISATVELPRDRAGVGFRKSYHAEQSSMIMPTDASLSELVQSTLRDLLTPMALELKSHLPQN